MKWGLAPRNWHRGIVPGTLGLLMAAAMVAGSIAPVWAAPLPPQAFWGQAIVNGGNATEGLIVSARIGGVEYGAGVTDTDGRYGSSAPFNVAADDPDTPEREGGVSGEQVDFFVNGVPGGSAVFASGLPTAVDLGVELAEYVLGVTSTGGGSVSGPGEGNFSYLEGTTVDLTAVPGPFFVFVNWTGDVAAVADVNAAATTVAMNGAYAIQANFAPLLDRDLTITSGAGGNVTVPGEGVFPSTLGTVVDLLAAPDPGFAFGGWTGDVVTVANAGAANTTITMDGDYAIMANFTEVVTSDLMVTSSSGGNATAPGEGVFTYTTGAVVDLLAMADPGFAFAGWTGDVGTVADGNASATTIAMNGDYAVQASFAEIGTSQLTVISSIGGDAARPGEGVFTYTTGEVVDLLALADPDFAFAGWTGDVGTMANASAANTTIIMDGDHAILADFTAVVTSQLTVTSSSGGNATAPGEGVFAYIAGAAVDLLAAPDEGFVFAGWVGDTGAVADANASATTIAMNGDYTVRADFTEVVTSQLTVLSSSGGNVTAPGEGVFTYTTGEVVALLAAPDAGFVFAGWTGDVGTVADVNAADTTIIMNGDYAILAVFEESAGTPPTPTPTPTPTPAPPPTPTPTPTPPPLPPHPHAAPPRGRSP